MTEQFSSGQLSCFSADQGLLAVNKEESLKKKQERAAGIVDLYFTIARH